jgi:hypothetical protein
MAHQVSEYFNMAIVNIREAMTRGIGSVGTKIKNIGRNLSEAQENFRGRSGMIGMGLSRVNLAKASAIGVGGIAGATLLTRYSGHMKDNDPGTGIVDNTDGGRRFGSLNSNIGYNRIPGLNNK